jgi:N-acetylglucosaminyldiphosphoundecaprenol N-acetyl-beta-D-mannosaminyltransferase
MKFCNINFNLRNKSDVFEPAHDGKMKIIITVFAQTIIKTNESEHFFNIINNNYVTFDGTITYLVAKIVNFLQIRKRKKFDFEKLSGADIVYDFCDFAKINNYKIFFLGGKTKNNETAVYKIKESYNIKVAGYSPDFENYPFSDNFNNACLDKIKHYRPDILFVGFGVPKQEYWIDDNKAYLSEIGVKYAIGSGGTVDFVSQEIKRAPVFIQKIGFEGAWRFFQEPNWVRFKRIFEAFKFFKYIWRKPDFCL